jgi:hypothetical protein
MDGSVDFPESCNVVYIAHDGKKERKNLGYTSDNKTLTLTHLSIATMASTALKSFSLTNSITDISPQDAIFKFDAAENRKINQEAPWTKEYVSLQVISLDGIV